MRKLDEIFKLLWIQKRIVAAATIWGNTVITIKTMSKGPANSGFNPLKEQYRCPVQNCNSEF